MVASRFSTQLVPISFLDGASCLLPPRLTLPTEPTPPPTSDFRSGVVPGGALTPAEERVLAHVLAGLSNKEIASALGRAEATVKNQVASVLRKYHVPSRARLMAVLR